jgi:hypothetical protein
MIRDPDFVMEFRWFGGDSPPACLAFTGTEADESHAGEAVEKWW